MRWLVLVALLFGFSMAAEASESPQPITIYSSSKEHLIRPVLNEFTKATGIAVRLTTLSNAAIVSRLELEGEDTQADAVIIADVANLHKLKEKGLLAPVVSEVVKKNIPAVLRDEAHEWAGITMRARFVFRRANDREAATITAYQDIAEPKWKDSILVRSSDNVYNQSLLSDLIHRLGENRAAQWAKGVVANMARDPQGGDRDQLRALASGVGRFAIANSYYYAQMLAGKDETDRALAAKIKPILFETKSDDAKHVNIRGVAMTKYATHAKQVRQLIEFLTSEKAQRYLTTHNYEYPANPSVEAAPVLQRWGYTPSPTVPLSIVGAGNAKAVALFSQAGWK